MEPKKVKCVKCGAKYFRVKIMDEEGNLEISCGKCDHKLYENVPKGAS